MNSWMGGPSWGGGSWLVYKTTTDIDSPAERWVLIEEREDSINDGYFVVDMAGYPNQPRSWRIVDFPASYHNKTAALAFSDGHAEFHKWIDPRTTPLLRKGQELQLNVSSPNNKDINWLQVRSTISLR